MIAVGYAVTYIYLGLLICVCNILNKKLNVNNIITRKIIHIGVSFCYVISYLFFKNTINMIIPPLTFIVINYVSYKKKMFKGMEVDNATPGTVYYAISVFVMALITYFKNDFYPFYGIGIFILAFADGLAPFISNLIKSRKLINNKTISGTLTVFIVSLIVIIVVSNIFNINFSILKYLLLALLSCIFELIGKNGLDNIYLPIGISIIGYLLGGI